MARFASTVVVGLLLVCTMMPQANAQTCYALTLFGRIPVACPPAPATAAPATAAPTTAAPAAAPASSCPAAPTLSYCPLYKVMLNTCQSGNGIGLGLIGNLLLPTTNLATALAGYPAANVQALGSFMTNAGTALSKLQQPTVTWVPLGLLGK